MADVPAIRITAVDDASKVFDSVAGSLGRLAASVVSFAAVTATLKSALSFGDELQTTSERLGIQVGKLQELSAIAVQSGTSLEGMGKAYKGLSQSMVAAQNSASEQGKIFAALGVSVKDAAGNMKTFTQITPELSDALNSISDETLRMAAGVKLFGKGYTESAAAIRTFSSAQAEANDMIKIFGTVTPQAAQAADQLGDRMNLIWQGIKASVLTEMTTGFASLGAAMKELEPLVAGTASAFSEFINWIATEGTPWVIKFTGAMEKVGHVIRLVGQSWFASTEDQERNLTRLKEILSEVDARTQQSLNKVKIAAVGSTAGIQPDEQTTSVEEMNRLLAAQARLRGALTPAIAAQKDALDGLLASMMKEYAKAEDYNAVDKLTVALNQAKLGAITKEKQAMIEYLYVIARRIDADKELDAAQKELFQDQIQYNKGLADEEAAHRKNVVSVEDYVSKIELQTSMMFASNDEKEKMIALLELEQRGIKLTTEEYDAYVARLSSAKDAQAAMQPWVDAMHSVQQAAEDAFTHILDKGTNVWKSLTETLKTTFLKLLYEISIKQWVVSITASVASSAASAAGSSLGSVGTSWLSNPFGSGFSLSNNTWGGTASGMGPPTSTGSMSMGYGDYASGALGGAGIGAGIGSLAASLFGNERNSKNMQTGATIGGAIGSIWGPIGALIGSALGAAVGSLIKSGGGPKIGGTAGIVGNTYPGETTATGNAQMQTLVDATQASYKQIAAALGGHGVAGFGFSFDTDPKGTAASRISGDATVNGKSVYSFKNIEVGRTAEELAAALSLETKRALVAAVAASDLPGVLGKMFANMDFHTLSESVADNLIAFSEGYKALYDVFNANPMDEALTAIKDAATGATGALDKQGQALLDLLDVYDGTGTATQELATATTQYYNNVVILIAQIQQLKTAIATMFADSIKTYNFAKLDTQGQYDYLMGDASSLQAKLQKATNPDDINRLASAINADQQQAFGMLTPEQQKAAADDFIARANQVNDLAQKKLDDAAKAAETQLNTILTAIKTAIDGAAAQFSAAAGQVSGAGVSMNDAAAHIDHAAATLENRPLVTG